MKKQTVVLLGLLSLIGLAGAMVSTNYDLSWHVIGGGGGPMSSTNYTLDGTVGQIIGVSESTNYRLEGGYWSGIAAPSTPTPTPIPGEVIPLPGYDNPPTDPDGDGLYEDLNGNGGLDFNDVVQLFKYLEWIEANEPIACFDFNGNGRLDFADIVQLFKEV